MEDDIGRDPSPTDDESTKPRAGAASLMDYLRASFYLGKLSTGDKLPSYRELAKQLEISPTTALELYHILESEGFLDSRQRSGTFLRRVGMEADHQPKEMAVFRLLCSTVRRLNLLGFSPTEYARLIRRFSGAETRQDFAFGVVMHEEAFEIASSTIERVCHMKLPIVRLSPDRGSRPTVKATLARNGALKCLVATYLHVETATELATEFGRNVLLARPERAAESVFAVSPGARRFVVTRDRETAEDLASLIRKIFEPGKAARFLIAAQDDEEGLTEIAREAVHVLVSPMAYAATRARLGPAVRLEVIPNNLSDDTVEEMLFHYLFA